MKIFVFLKVILAITLCTHLSAFNFEKLQLSQLIIQNQSNDPVTIAITFQSTSKTCYSQQGILTRTCTVDAGKTETIKQVDSVIKTIKADKSHLNLAKNFSADNPLFVVQDTPQTPLLSQNNFETTLLADQEYQSLLNGNLAYAQSMPQGVTPQRFFNRLKSLYEKNDPSHLLNNEKNQSVTPKIPYIVHLIWMGNKTNYLPTIFQKWLSNWKKIHPGWEFKLWNDALIKKEFPEGLINQKIYNEASELRDYGIMSKVARYEILHKFGGLFIEPNLVCHESFEPLHATYDFYAGLGTLRSYGAVSNAVIGSCPGHPILQTCIALIHQSDSLQPEDKYGIGSWMTRHLANTQLTEAVYENAGKGTTDIIFPRTFFDGSKIKKQFYHQRSTHEPKYYPQPLTLEAFCSLGAFCHNNNQKHSFNKENLENLITADAAALEYLASTPNVVEEKPLVIIIASYNNKTWYKRNLSTLFMQNYSNYRVIYLDDASPDGTGNLVEAFVKEHHLEEKVTIIKNKEREGAGANFYKAVQLCHDDEIMLHYDGDDWFTHENVFKVVNKFYTVNDVWMTYGQFVTYPEQKPGYSKNFPQECVDKNGFRDHPIWLSHHLRTNYVWLFKQIKLEDLKYKGKFFPSAWDHPAMFSMLEMSGNRAKCIPYVLYVYNKANPINDHKVDLKLQNFFVRYARRHQKRYSRLEKRPITYAHTNK